MELPESTPWLLAAVIVLYAANKFLQRRIIDGLEKENDWYILGIIYSQKRSFFSFGPQTVNIRFALGKHEISYENINLIIHIQERLKYSDKGRKIQPLFKKKAIQMKGTTPQIGEGMCQSFMGIRHNGHRLFGFSSRMVMKKFETLQSELQTHFFAGIMDACGVLEDGKLFFPQKMNKFSSYFSTKKFQNAMICSRKFQVDCDIEEFKFEGEMDATQSLYSLVLKDCINFIHHLIRLFSPISSNIKPYSEDMLVLAGIGLQGSDWVSRGKWRGGDQLSCRIQTKKKNNAGWWKRQDYMDWLPMVDCSNRDCSGTNSEGKRGEYRYNNSTKTTELWQRNRNYRGTLVLAECGVCREYEEIKWPASASWGWRTDDKKKGWNYWEPPPPISHDCSRCGTVQDFMVPKYGKEDSSRGFSYFFKKVGEGPAYCISEPYCPFCKEENSRQNIGEEAVPIYLEMSSRIQKIFGSNVEFTMISNQGEQTLSWKVKGSFWNPRLRLMLGLTGIKRFPDRPFEKPPKYLVKWDEKKAVWDLGSLAPPELATEYIRSVIAVTGLGPSPSHRQSSTWRVQFEPKQDSWEWMVPTCLLGQERCDLSLNVLNWQVVGVKVPLNEAKAGVEVGNPNKFRGHNQQSRFIMSSYVKNVGYLNPEHHELYEGGCVGHPDFKENDNAKCGWEKAKKEVSKFDWVTQDEWTQAINSSNPKYKKMKLVDNDKPQSSHGFNFSRMPTRIKNQVFSGQYDMCHTMGCPHIGKCTTYPDFEGGE